MPTITLPFVLGLAAFFVAAVTVLPGVLLKLVALVRRRESPRVLGPLFWHELVRVTRRGTHLRLRTAYSLTLLLALFVSYVGEFREINPVRLLVGTDAEVPRERITRFAEHFFHVFLFCQLIALTAVTPVFAGGAVTEEKDRGTLAFLQTSLLSDREIVLGKLAARVVFVLGLALTGLPVLALTLLFGGVDPDVLFTSFAAAVVSTVTLAAFSFWRATEKDSLKEVLPAVYGYVTAGLLFGTCCGLPTAWLSCASPFSLIITSVRGGGPKVDVLELAALFVVVHGLLGILFAVLATGGIRAVVAQQIVTPVLRTPAPHPDFVLPETRRERPPVRLWRIPHLEDDDPLLWKEKHFGGRAMQFESDLRGCVLALLVVALVPLTFGIAVSLLTAPHPAEVVGTLFCCAAVAAGTVLIPLAGVRATGCVVRERQRQTLDSLLTLPADRADLLRAKWHAAVVWLKPWLYGLVAVGAVAATATASAGSALGVFLAGVLIGAATAFFPVLGVWLSVRCGTVVRAATWFLGLTFAAFLLPPMLAVFVRGAAALLFGSAHVFEAATISLSLPFAIGIVSTPPSPSDRSDRWLAEAAAGLLLAGTLFTTAALLWRDAIRRFEAEGR